MTTQGVELAGAEKWPLCSFPQEDPGKFPRSWDTSWDTPHSGICGLTKLLQGCTVVHGLRSPAGPAPWGPGAGGGVEAVPTHPQHYCLSLSFRGRTDNQRRKARWPVGPEG